LATYTSSINEDIMLELENLTLAAIIWNEEKSVKYWSLSEQHCKEHLAWFFAW